jgi:hypothetical protein
MSAGSGMIQFINLSYRGEATSGKLQRQANSHAARIAHAKARRLCITEYQASKTSQIPEDTQRLKKRGSVPRGREQPTLTEELFLPSPVSLLASDRRDPFQSFARSFQPIEHFLLDYCKSLQYFYSYYQSEI